MTDLVAELEAVAKALTESGVDFAVCGGLAVAIHGHVRATRDIDLMAFADVWATRQTYEREGTRLPVVSRQGLIAMKRLAGRAQDLADIEALERPDV